MKFTTRALSFIIALTVLLATVIVVGSVSTVADDPAPTYAQQFTEANFVKWWTIDEIDTLQGSTDFEPEKTGEGVRELTYKSNGSFDIKKSKDFLGAAVEFKLSDGANEVFQTAEEGKLVFTMRAENAVNAEGLDRDTQFITYLKYTDGTMKKLNTTYIDKFATKTVELAMTDKDGNVLADLSTVEGFLLCLYHYNAVDSEMLVSGFTAKGGAAPEIEPFPDPVVEDGVKTATAFEFDPNYRQDYSSGPSGIKYSPDKKVWRSSKAKGYVNLVNINTADQTQVFFKFDRETMNYALAVANKAGNSGYVQFDVTVTKCVDSNGKKLDAEMDFLYATYNDGYLQAIKEWQSPGTTVTYFLDVSKFGSNDISAIRFSIQNYWFLSEDGKYVESKPVYAESDTEKKEVLYYEYFDRDGKKVGDSKDGKKYTRMRISNLDAIISPITVCETAPELDKDGKPINVIKTETTPAPTTQSDKVDPNAGLKFFTFTPEAMDETFGNAPNDVVYYNEKGSTTYSLEKKQYKGDPVVAEGDDAYKADWAEKSAKDYYAGPFTLGFKSDTVVSEQHQMGWFTSAKYEEKSFTDYAEKYKNETDKTDYNRSVARAALAKTKNYNSAEQMQKAVDAANNHLDPSLRGYLCCDVKVNSAVLGTNLKYDIFVEFQISLHGADGANVMLRLYPEDRDKIKTLYIDVSEVTDASEITLVRMVAQNYYFFNQELKKYDGIAQLDVEYSDIYVPGKSLPAPVTVPANEKEAKAIARAYKALPGRNINDYLNAAGNVDMNKYNKLVKFIDLYSSAEAATLELVALKFGITEDMYGEMNWLWMDLTDMLNGQGGGDGEGEDNPPLGDVSLPALLLVTVLSLSGLLIIYRRRQRA